MRSLLALQMTDCGNLNEPIHTPPLHIYLVYVCSSVFHANDVDTSPHQSTAHPRSTLPMMGAIISQFNINSERIGTSDAGEYNLPHKITVYGL